MKTVVILSVFFCFLSLSQISLANPELVGEWEQLSYACVDGTTTLSLHPSPNGQKTSLEFTSTASTTGNAALKWTDLAVGSVLSEQIEYVRKCDDVSDTTFSTTECAEHKTKLANMQETGIYCTVTHTTTYLTSAGDIDFTIGSTTSEGCTPSGGPAPGATFGFSYSIAPNRLYLVPDNAGNIPFTCTTGSPTVVLTKM